MHILQLENLMVIPITTRQGSPPPQKQILTHTKHATTVARPLFQTPPRPLSFCAATSSSTHVYDQRWRISDFISAGGVQNIYGKGGLFEWRKARVIICLCISPPRKLLKMVHFGENFVKIKICKNIFLYKNNR